MALDLLNLDAATAEQAAHLPPLHADPFDRALIALARRTGHHGADSPTSMIGHYGVRSAMVKCETSSVVKS